MLDEFDVDGGECVKQREAVGAIKSLGYARGLI